MAPKTSSNPVSPTRGRRSGAVSEHPRPPLSCLRRAAEAQLTSRATADLRRRRLALTAATRQAVRVTRQEPRHDDRRPDPGELVHSLAYVSFQELATRVSHRNTGTFTADPMCEELLARIAADENLHMIFYRNLLGAALELSPNQAMAAIRDVVTGFQMPGTDIPGFQRKAVEMAVAGIYDLRIHRDDVVAPVLRFWKIWDLEGLDETGESARQEVSDFMDTLETQASRFEDKRDTLKERMKIG